MLYKSLFAPAICQVLKGKRAKQEVPFSMMNEKEGERRMKAKGFLNLVAKGDEKKNSKGEYLASHKI